MKCLVCRPIVEPVAILKCEFAQLLPYSGCTLLICSGSQNKGSIIT